MESNTEGAVVARDLRFPFMLKNYSTVTWSGNMRAACYTKLILKIQRGAVIVTQILPS